MKENFDAIDILIYVGKWIGGVALTFVTFMGKVLYSNNKELNDKVTQVKHDHDNFKLACTGKNAQLLARIDATESKNKDQLSRVEELSELKFKEIHRDLEYIKENQEKTNELLTKFLTKN